MRKIFIFGLLSIAIHVQAQVKAITETGDEVLLFPDNTWSYTNGAPTDTSAIRMNDTPFHKSSKSTFLVKSKKVNLGIWLDPKLWSFSGNADNEAAEFSFQLKGNDLYGMLISEKIEVPIETLKGIALQNARNAGPDIRIVNEEYRNVNGLRVLMMHMKGTIQGMKISYYGYYYSNSSGTIQLLTYTSENLMKEYQTEMDTFLNGLVEW